MTDLEKEINDISGLRQSIPNGTIDEEGLERAIDTKNEMIKGACFITAQLNKGIAVPDFFDYLRLYTKQFAYYNEAEQTNIRKLTNDRYKDIVKLMDFFGDTKDSEIESITFKAKNGVSEKLTSKLMIDGLTALIKESANMAGLPAIVGILGKPDNSPKKGAYNKDFIRGLYPLFKHIKKHNPKRSDKDLYQFLIDFLEALGFDFDKHYPNSVDQEPFKTYFKDLK